MKTCKEKLQGGPINVNSPHTFLIFIESKHLKDALVGKSESMEWNLQFGIGLMLYWIDKHQKKILIYELCEMKYYVSKYNVSILVLFIYNSHLLFPPKFPLSFKQKWEILFEEFPLLKKEFSLLLYKKWEFKWELKWEI